MGEENFGGGVIAPWRERSDDQEKSLPSEECEDEDSLRVREGEGAKSMRYPHSSLSSVLDASHRSLSEGTVFDNTDEFKGRIQNLEF